MAINILERQLNFWWKKSKKFGEFIMKYVREIFLETFRFASHACEINLSLNFEENLLNWILKMSFEDGGSWWFIQTGFSSKKGLIQLNLWFSIGPFLFSFVINNSRGNKSIKTHIECMILYCEENIQENIFSNGQK